MIREARPGARGRSEVSHDVTRRRQSRERRAAVACRAMAWLVALAPAKAEPSAPLDALREPPAPLETITLERAIRLALEKNYGVRRVRNDLASSQSSLLSAGDRFGFRLSTRVSDGRTFQRNVDVAAPTGATLDLDVFDDAQSLDVELTREVKWGGSFRLEGSLTRSRIQYAEVEPLHLGDYGVSYSQPLWGGRGRRVATEGLVSAELSYLGATRRLVEREMQLVVDVTRSYHDTVRARELIAINETARQRAEQRLTLARLRLEEGLITPIDVKRAEGDLRDRESEVISAEESFQSTRDSLFFLLGLPLDARLDVTAAVPGFDPIEVDLDEAVAEAISNRLDLAAARDSVELADLAVDVARSNARPRLDVTLSAQVSTAEGHEAEKWADVRNEDEWSSSLVFTHVFGDRSEEEALVRSRLAAENRRVDLIESERRITLEVRAAVRRIRSLERRLTILARNRELAAESLHLAELQFEEDLISTTDLLQDQDNLVQAERRYLDALAEHATARVSLDLTLGRYHDVGVTARSELQRAEPAPPAVPRRGASTAAGARAP